VLPRFIVNVHGVGPQPAGLTPGERDYWVSTADLESVLDAVAASDVAIGLTFDDGFSSDVDLALPRLVDRGLTAVFFPCAGWLDRPGRVGVAGVQELLAAGMGLGTHGWCHRDWRLLRPDQVDEEFRRSSEVLAEVAGIPIRSAAIPFGNYDRRVLRGLRGLGYEHLYTSDAGLVPRNAWRVPRTSVRPGSDGAWLTEVLARAQRPPRQLRDRLVRGMKSLRGAPRP
jgi:peptidoglycan/xylan/chitin deacetylase (PgdA/CDA1 family)